ncbi:MAG TPA: hypothetical protein VM581_01170 [Magnetospirillaceae bacterium]|nr:hypothetical protein [Magnetospirillaceae bacterium]
MKTKDEDQSSSGGGFVLTLIVVSLVLAAGAAIWLVVDEVMPDCTIVRVGQSRIVFGHTVEVRQAENLGQQTELLVTVNPGATPIWTSDVIVRKHGRSGEDMEPFSGQLITPTTLTIPTKPYAGLGGNIVGIRLCDK